MVKACGIVTVCSPRGPIYSGKLIARAVDLYLNGVKPGYIRWHDLQRTLEQEFPKEFPKVGADQPSPDTVLAWVRKYPDAPQRLRDLRVQELEPAGGMLWNATNAQGYQAPQPVAVPYVGPVACDINAVIRQYVGLMTLAMMVYIVSFWLQSLTY